MSEYSSGNTRPGSWPFPADLDVARKTFLFREESPERLAASTFLDSRHFDDNDGMQAVPLSALATAQRPIAQGHGLLLHTSFCCSTLLARLLQVPGKSICLKEPLVLRRLADAALAAQPDMALTAAAMRLLFEAPDGLDTVLVKPTHVALTIADALLDAAPGTRTVILTSSLESFLISNIKKPDETKRKVPELVERFMGSSSLPSRLPETAFAPPDFLCAVALQWHAQRQIVNDLLAGRHAADCSLIDEQTLLSEPETTLHDVSEWLGMRLDAQTVRDQIDAVMHRHAKATKMPYSPDEKSYENGLLRSRYAREIESALDWSRRYLTPHLTERP